MLFCATAGADTAAPPNVQAIGPVIVETREFSDPYGGDGVEVTLVTEVNGAAALATAGAWTIVVFPETRVTVNETAGEIRIETGAVALIADEQPAKVNVGPGTVSEFSGVARIRVCGEEMEIRMLDGHGAWDAEDSAELLKGRIYSVGHDGELKDKGKMGRPSLHGARSKVEVYLAKTGAEAGPLNAGDDYQPPLLEDQGCIEVCPIE